MSGAAQASWLSRLPAIRDRLDTDLTGLGVALFVLGAGTLVSMPLAGLACWRFGSGRVVFVSASAASLALVGVGLAGSQAQLVGVLFGLGLASGAWDAAMNVQGVTVERKIGGHWMTRLHGWWSVGTVAGAGLGALAAWAQVPMSMHLGVVGAASVALCSAGATALLDDRMFRAFPLNARPRRQTATLRLAIIALLMAVGATIEGAAGDWLALYLSDFRDFSHAGAAVGYGAFLGAMVVGRFTADRLYRWMGLAATVRAGALLAGVGIAILVLVPAAPPAFVGTLCWGLGMCVVFPAVLSVGGRVSSRPSQVVGLMTMVGYGAGFVAPPFIGALADEIGLNDALLVLPFLAIVVVLLAPCLGRGSGHPPGVPTR